MQSTALPPLLTDLPADDRARVLDDEALRHLPAVFAAVPDPRERQGRRYPLPFLLTCLVAALLCDCNSTAAIGQWCIERRALLARHFPHQRAHTPTGALYRWLLPRLSVAELEWALASWVRQTRPTRDREPLALDGKVVRGALTITQPAPHLLSVSTHQTHETLIQIRVSDKTNEIPVAQALLPHLPLRGRVVTADALHTQSALAQVIRDQGEDYVLCVKGNQPRLYAELACYCDDPQATAVSATTLDRRRGRTETRTLHVTTRLNAYVLTSAACLGVLQGCPLLQEGSNLCLQRFHRRHKGRPREGAITDAIPESEDRRAHRQQRLPKARRLPAALDKRGEVAPQMRPTDLAAGGVHPGVAAPAVGADDAGERRS